ncbi:MAG: hypothetical protein ABR998_13575 [Gemmatimonadales bacterium]
MTPKPGRARITGEHFTHRYLWSVAQTLGSQASAAEEGQGVLRLAEMLFTYLAFEAYLNYLGARLCPQEWANEREFFGSGQFHGTVGKAEYLAHQLSVDLAPGKRPLQTVVELDRRRDKLVHGRTESLDREVTFKDPAELSSVEPEIHTLADEKFLGRALEDVEVCCDALHAAAIAKVGLRALLAQRAFVGMIAHQGGTILEMPS